MKLKHKKLLYRLIAIAALLTVYGLLCVAKKSEWLCEFVFARGFSRAYVYVLGHISDIFPFSVMELFIFVCIIAIILLLIFWIKKFKRKRGSRALLSILNVLIACVSIVVLYTVTAGMAYGRRELPLPQYEGKQFSEEELGIAARKFLADYRRVSAEVERDENGFTVFPSNEELAKMLIEEYSRLDFDGYFSSYTPRVKAITVSEFMCYQNITGVTFAPTGEANINSKTPACYRVTTMAHELAHIKGVMRENDANFTAYYLLLTSEKPILRYCGYMYSIYAFLNVAYYMNAKSLYRELLDELPKSGVREREREWDSWEKYDTFVDKAAEFFKNLYLMLSGVKEGTDSYQDVTVTKTVIDESGKPKIVLVEYSPVQKLYAQMYKDGLI